jgi:NTP pyrophosphatase (non-canonical NTP hydrolase)
VTEQLTLAIDLPVPGPQLVVTLDDANTVTGMSNQTSATPELGLAELGEVLALVLGFHEAFDLPREPLPTSHVGDTVAQLRVRLLREEVEEFADGTERGDVVAIADALADVVYVAYGSAITYGIDLDAVVREVHRSNMSKLDANGRPVLREDGKVLKSERYRPPNVGSVIDEQLPLFDPDGPTPSHTDVHATVAAG